MSTSGYTGLMETATEAKPSLTALDRCDRCGAQALVRATMSSGYDLIFCNHHGNAIEADLVAQGATISRQPVPA